jgi:hypothetical protein
MAKVTIQGVKELVKALEEGSREVYSAKNMLGYGQQASDMIKLRTRLGSGVSGDGADKEKLKPLADSTHERRKALQKKGKLSGLTSPGKSNLTQSGQLLDSVTPISSQIGSVTVSPQGSRDDGKDNADIGRYVTDAGRPFNHLSKVEIRRIQTAVQKDLRDAIKRRLTK